MPAQLHGDTVGTEFHGWGVAPPQLAENDSSLIRKATST